MITAVLPYFRTRLNGLSFKEWKDGFNFENIPATILDRSYHMVPSTGTRVPPYASDGVQRDEITIIRVFRKGFRDVASALAAAKQDVETIELDVCKAENRLTSDLKNVYLETYDFEQKSSDNDNLVITVMNFRTKTFYKFT